MKNSQKNNYSGKNKKQNKKNDSNFYSKKSNLSKKK